ncbi:extracellular solute-binding protein [Paenibacillus sp. 22594]|uniref:extracellular solute-binding protein n=1 Tax=Paenibacillus sp. 22594 TaxID=3453947 RepID=UPI003F861BAB
MNMSKKVTGSSGLALILATVLVLSGCSDKEAQVNNEPKAQETAAGTAGANAGTNAPAGQKDGKYDPPIEIVAAQLAESNWVYDSGDDINNNVWSRYFSDTLGIKVKLDWTAAKAEDYTNKLNVIIGSGDNLPDMFQVNSTQLQQLVEEGQLADLTEAFEQSAKPFTKELMNKDGGIGISSATFDGKLMALPNLAGTITNNDVLWLRSDWLKKLGLAEPATIGDLEAIADAFVNKDPDGNGKKDSYGLGIAQGPVMTGGDVADLGGWFAGFKAYPGMWVKGSDGKIVYGGIQPQVKEALLKLQELYKNGLIDKEWIVKDGGKLGEDIIGNKLGMWYGGNWNSLWPIDVSKNADLVNLKPYSIVSVDGSKPVVQAVNPTVNSYTVIRKGYEHPEAAVKLLNEFQEKMWGATSENAKFGANMNVTPVVSYFKYPLVQSWPTTKDIPDNLDAVEAALTSGDSSKLNSEQIEAFNAIEAFKKGDIAKGYGTMRQFDAFAIIKKDNLPNQLKSEFYGAPTPTMVTKKSSLDKLEQEVFTKIIMNKGSGEDFDKFVADWNSLGGEQITKEVNDWKASH